MVIFIYKSKIFSISLFKPSAFILNYLFVSKYILSLIAFVINFISIFSELSMTITM